VAAVILATLFLIGRSSASRTDDAAATPTMLSQEGAGVTPAGSANPPGHASSTPHQGSTELDRTSSSELESPAGEDASGPIWPSVQTASDEDTWKVWFDQPSQSKSMSKGQFEDSMKVLGTFNTMADFWDKFSNLMHEKLPTKSNVRVFQSNVRPLWEDPVNHDGGKWIVVVPKPKSVGVFNEVLAAMVSNKFNCEISGLVLSKKVREDLVSVWTPSGLPIASLEHLRDTISQLLELHLGLKPEITFMSHKHVDKKNKINIAGKGEKEKRDGTRSSPGLPAKRAQGAKSGAQQSEGTRAIPTPKSAELRPQRQRVSSETKTPERKPMPAPQTLSDDEEDDLTPTNTEGEWEVVRSRSAKTSKPKDSRNRFKSL